MKKYISKIISILLVMCLVSPTLTQVSFAVTTAVQATKPLKLGNDVIEFAVDKRGRFQIRTTEEGSPVRPNDGRQSMLFFDGENETSFTTFRIDGEDYIFGENYAYSMSRKAQLVGETVKMNDSIVTTYQIGDENDHVDVVQSLSIIKDKTDTNFGNVFIQYALQNNTGRKVEIGARILQDVMLGDNDGPAIKVEDSFYDKELEFVGDEVPDVWRSTDNEFAPNIVGYGRTNGWGNVKPDRMIVGHWQGLSQTPFDYDVEMIDESTSKINFTIESEYGRRDTAVAYYWEPKEVDNKGVMEFETYYGIGQIPDKVYTYATNISAPTQLLVNDEQTAYVNDGEFEIAVMVENNLPNSEEIYEVMANLTFEDGGGVVSLNDDVPFKGTKLIKVGGQYTFRWKMKADASVDYKAIKYKVDLYDSRNVYKEEDEIPVGKQVGDVRLDEIYTVTKGLVLPSKTGAAPSISFGTVSPDEIYYSGKNLISINTIGLPLLVNQSNWQLEYKIANDDYKVVPSSNINLVQEYNSMEVLFDEQLKTGEMDFRIRVLKDIYKEGDDTSKHILKDDILKIPGSVLVTKDKAAIPRTFGTLAIVSDVSYDDSYNFTYTTHAVPLSGEVELNELKKAIQDANNVDEDNIPDKHRHKFHGREVLTVIDGDIRAIKEGGKLDKYVVYASHKRALINNVITYTSAMPLTIQYDAASKGVRKRTSLDWMYGDGGMSSTLKDIIKRDTKIDEAFSNTQEGSMKLIANDDVEIDFTYVNKASNIAGKAKEKIDYISGIGSASKGQSDLDSRINKDNGVLSITGMGILGINSGDGFDFWMDMFTVEFYDDTKYALWDANDETIMSVRFNLEGIGSVLNKALDGMPVQIGGVRLAYDATEERDMLTFDATVDLKMLPGRPVVNAEEIYFSNKGYEGMIVDAHVNLEEGVGMIKELDLDVDFDTYNGGYSIVGQGQVAVVKAHLEFSIYKERANDTWYLNDAVIAGGKEPGIQVYPGVFVTKLGGGVRNLQKLTNPYFDDPDALFTVVVLMGLNVVETLEGDFEGQITRRYISVDAEKAKIKGLDIFRNLGVKLSWDTGGKEIFYVKAKGEIDVAGALSGKATLYISDIFFEGTASLKVQIPKKVPLVGGMSLARVFFGINNDKMWGSLKVNLLLTSVDVGATYWWRGKFNVSIGEAGPSDVDQLKPKGALYEGEMTDHNGDTVDYFIGTNVDVQSNAIKKSSSIMSLALLEEESADFVGDKKELSPSTNIYTIDDQPIAEASTSYDLTSTVNSKTKLVFELEGLEDDSEAQLKLYVKDNDSSNLLDTGYGDIKYTYHINNDKKYITASGFTGEDTEKKFVVVSEKSLANVISYDDMIKDEISGQNVYEFTMNTDDDTQVVFKNTGDEDLKLTFYKFSGTTYDGKTVIGQVDEEITSETFNYRGNKYTAYKGFAPNLKNVKILASSENPILDHTLVTSVYSIDAKKTSVHESDLVAEFVSNSNFVDAQILYVVNPDGKVIQLPEDADLSLLCKALDDYYTMLFPFEKAGEYKVYSTIDIDSSKSKVYEIEKMPELDGDSVEFKVNAISDQALDISWIGSAYRYTRDEAKGTGKTVFKFYLVDSDQVIESEEGYIIDADGTYLGDYDIESGNPNKYTVNIPKNTMSGDYYIKVVQTTEGLSHKFAYSSKVYTYVNKEQPEKVKNLNVKANGNGLLKVDWKDDNTDIENYYIEVFNADKEIVEDFGIASVDGNIKEAIIGGVYETFDPKDPDKSIVKGLETDKDYIVGITPVRKVDDETIIDGETAYSDLVRLLSPNPAILSMDFENTESVDITESSYGIDKDGNESREEITLKGIRIKDPVIKFTSDQKFKSKVYLDNVELQSTDVLSDSLKLQLSDLTEGAHYIDIVSQNANKDKSHDSYKFYVDTRSPEILVESPVSNQFLGEGINSVLVKGKTEVGARLYVNGQEITVDEKGKFNSNIDLISSKAKTEILLESKDAYGNITKNKSFVLRKVDPIKGIVIESDIPAVTNTIKKPVYKFEDTEVYNAFTGKNVIVPMSTDVVLYHDEETIIENQVKMGKVYNLDVKGKVSDKANKLIGLDDSKISFEIVQGSKIAKLDKNKLTVTNKGTVVVKATYEVMGDVKETTEDESFQYTKFMTISSEYADIYADLPEPEPKPEPEDKDKDNNTGNSDRDDKKKNTATNTSSSSSTKTEKETKKVYHEENKTRDGILVAPSVFKKLKDKEYETISIETKDYTIVMDNPNNPVEEEELIPDGDLSIATIPEGEGVGSIDEEILVPSKSIDFTLSMESPKEKDIKKLVSKASSDKDKEPVIVHFNHHGNLPAKSKVKVNINKKSQNLYMYYYDETKDKLSLYGYVRTNEKGEVAFEIDHCSDYVFVDSLIAGNDAFLENQGELRYINGHPDGTFSPDDSITRAEVATIISNLLKDSKVISKVALSDIDMWAEESIQKLVNYGYINGYQDGTFRPDAKITREELATLFARIINPERSASFRHGGFSDIDDSWAKDSIMKCYRLGIVNGFKGKYDPQSYATRAEVVTMVNNILNRHEDTSSVKNPFSDVKKDHWAYSEILNAIHN